MMFFQKYVRQKNSDLASKDVSNYFENFENLYYAKRTGNVVQFSGTIRSNDMSISGTQGTVNIIKSGLRPLNIVTVTFMRGGKTDTVDLTGYVNSNGLLLAFAIGGATIPSNVGFFVTGTYVIE